VNQNHYPSPKPQNPKTPKPHFKFLKLIELQMVDPTPQANKEIDLRAGKIDYSNNDPIAFKKTATLVNYFIINTS